MFTEGFVFSDLSPLTSKIDISNIEYKGGDSETKLGNPAFSNTGPVLHNRRCANFLAADDDDAFVLHVTCNAKQQNPDYTGEHQKDVEMIKSRANKTQQTCAQATALKVSVAVSNDLIINQISQMT